MSMFGDAASPVKESYIKQLVLDKDIRLMSTNMLHALRNDTVDLMMYHAQHYVEVGDEEFDEVRLLKATLDAVDFELEHRNYMAEYLGKNIQQRYEDYIKERVERHPDRKHAH